MNVFIVYLETGEYDDHCKEIHSVFDSEEKANAYKDKLESELKEDELFYSEYKHVGLDIRHVDEIKKKYGWIDYTGAWCSVGGPYEVK